MKRQWLTILILFTSVFIVSYLVGSCKKHDIVHITTSLQQVIPDGFPQPVYRFEDNPLTEEGFELGRKLFYDGRLSRDTGFPCSSCHQEIAIFGTYEHDRSHGYNFSHTLRNAPPLFNLAWQKELHWDGQFKSLYAEASQPILTHNEMAENFFTIIFRLGSDSGYRRMFKAAFGTPVVTEDRILRAWRSSQGILLLPIPNMTCTKKERQASRLRSKMDINCTRPVAPLATPNRCLPTIVIATLACL